MALSHCEQPQHLTRLRDSASQSKYVFNLFAKLIGRFAILTKSTSRCVSYAHNQHVLRHYHSDAVWIHSDITCHTFMWNTKARRHLSQYRTGICQERDIPAKKLRMVQAWIAIHEEELMADWTLALNGEPVFSIDPLR